MPTAKITRKAIERRRWTATLGRSNGGVSQISSRAVCRALAAASPAHSATTTPMTTVVQLPAERGLRIGEFGADHRNLAERPVDEVLASLRVVLEHEVEHGDERQQQREDAEERPVRDRRGETPAAVFAEALEHGERQRQPVVAPLQVVEVREKAVHGSGRGRATRVPSCTPP